MRPLLFALLILPFLTNAQLVNNAFNLDNDYGDFRMRRYVAGDLVWKRALVSGPTGLTINYNGDFSDGTRIMGSKLHVDGNLGIGTSSPARKLEVFSNSPVIRLKNSAEGTSSYGWLEFYDSNSRMGYLGFGSSNNNHLYITNEIGGNILIPSGKVGIGTSSPGTELDVNGAINGTGYISVSKGGGYRVAMNGQGHGYLVGRNDNVENKFQIHSNGTTWFNGGNVGIGTTTPDAKLAVNGNIHAKEVKVDLIGWPDYVFTNEYDLPTLEEVKNHIKEKGHLINIPSAKEVEENGVQLGEMNKLLLEKIEELTLYTLEQEKEIKAQKKQLKNKDKKITALEIRLQKIENLLNQKK